MVGKNPGNNLSRQDPPRIGISAAAKGLLSELSAAATLDSARQGQF